ncbi:translation initiation inhibitor [Catellatospora sp. TT07R-123]|nr:translation initiation inhibitor [Catellatospora sp. TT07R-123]
MEVGGPLRWVYVTGQVATDASGATVGADIATQAEQVYRNITAVLAEAGAQLGDLVAVTVYLVDRADFPAFTAVRDKVFAEVSPPSSTVVFVAGLVVPEHLVEISAVAAVPDGPR